MSRALIIGGTGSWGQELTKQILEKHFVNNVVVYSRGEHKQVEMARKFNDSRISFKIGDIRDRKQIEFASRDCDYIFHLAALKHVPVCERNPEETVKTNILGTENAVYAAIANKVKKFILVSTDKAVDPINVYGVSKSMAEKIVINANLKTQNTKFIVIRGGNVLGTNGSVVPLFKEQLLKANAITITSSEMTRYIMLLREAISLLFKAVNDAFGGEIFVLKMPSIKIEKLAMAMIHQFGNEKTKIHTIGVRPGEKIHEVLVSRYEAPRAFVYGNYFVTLPTIEMNNLREKWNDVKFLKCEYNSLENHQLKELEIIDLLKEDGWLNHVTDQHLEIYTKEELINYFKREKWL